MIIEKLMERSYIKPYMNVIRSYDMETYNHSVNVAKTAALIMDAYPDDINQTVYEEILMGALLHDIGKTLVPIQIIQKTEPLTKLDYAFIRQHPLNGLRMVKEEAFGELIEGIILKHHEKLNGKGYPCGYDMEEIEDAVRVVAMADVYSALTEHRGYKRAMNRRDSMHIIKKMVAEGELDSLAFDCLQKGLEYKQKCAI